MDIINRMLNSAVFWAAWIIIPVLMEILPAIGSLFVLVKHRIKTRKTKLDVEYYPEITIIIPVYNSAATLHQCIQSIEENTYPNSRIRVFLVNNESKDNSFSIFQQCQKEYPDLLMQWMNANQGKGKALNLALYNSSGKYIMNIDSDGKLDKHALENMVRKFESNTEVSCLTGAILTIPSKIQKYRLVFPRLLRIMEFMEYMQAFLAGRSYASETDRLYTISGAFSAFRKSAILQSRLYNTDTVSEDTHLTFQMKILRHERVEICEDALFYVDPIESFNKLYVQRQRWQRGSLEVAKMFDGKDLKIRTAYKDVNTSTLLFDHTFAFPRMIWYLAIILLVTLNYSGATLLYSFGVIFLLYIVIGYFYFVSVARFIRFDSELHTYYLKHFWAVALLPFYNLMVFFMRMAGIINSISTNSQWRTNDFTDERKMFIAAARDDVKSTQKTMQRISGFVNSNTKKQEELQIKGEAKIWYICMAIVYILPIILAYAGWFVHASFGVGIEEVLNTMTGPLQGTSNAMIMKNLIGIGVPTVLVVFAIVVICKMDYKKSKNKYRNNLKLHKWITYLCCIPTIVCLLVLNGCYGLVDYFKMQSDTTSIYEDYYTDAENVVVTAGEKKKNLVYIYVESLETTYADTASGGGQSENYIPHLTALAENNISFKDSSNPLGGLHNLIGTNWTMAALFASETGLPYKGAENENASDSQQAYANVTALGDILEKNGYTQEFLCGSNADFGGRKAFFQQHGKYSIMDLFQARKEGYLPAGYNDGWWGFEDYHLFDIAKSELTKMYALNQPFNLTMLTVDLHAPDGHECDKCDSQYANVTANVAHCNDEQIQEFLEWCKSQPFYEDTVFVITGDHPRMDSSLVKGMDNYDRTVYNVFVNTGMELDTPSRIATQLDMFPTVLSALGYTIEGDKLGLGVNLFSNQQTISEIRGFNWLYDEIQKNSSAYDEIMKVNA